jgi:hypothetical protein
MPGIELRPSSLYTDRAVPVWNDRKDYGRREQKDAKEEGEENKENMDVRKKVVGMMPKRNMERATRIMKRGRFIFGGLLNDAWRRDCESGMVGRLKHWEGFGRTQSLSNRDTDPAFNWGSEENHEKPHSG